jgi:DNA invertase Pin-like site-specific DNA recombinase
MPIAALYVRISQDRSGDELGIARQREDCEKLVQARGWELGDVYADDDRSAFSGKLRPAYEKMLAAIAAGEVGAVVAWHPDRLHRSPVELERFIDVVNVAGAEVATVQAGEFDLGTAAGRMVARVVGAVARHESEQKSERLRRQREQMALSGRPHGGRRAFGYDRTGSEVIDAEAALIREAVDRVLAGESLRTIAFDWNSRRVASTSGGPWGVTTLKSMLTGPRLAGLRVHRGDIIGKADWPAIITREQHDAVRAVLGNPRARKQGRPATSLLGGILVCGKCGAKMHASTRSGGARRYACVVRPETKGCGKVAIHAEHTEDLVVEVVMRRLDHASLGEHADGDQFVRDRADDVAALEDRLADLADAFAEGAITRPEWMRARAGIEKRLDDARRERDAKDAKTLLAPVAELGALRELWPTLDTDQRRGVLGAVLSYVKALPATKGAVWDPERVAIPRDAWKA